MASTYVEQQPLPAAGRHVIAASPGATTTMPGMTTSAAAPAYVSTAAPAMPTTTTHTTTTTIQFMEDPHDHWASRDLLLSMIPFLVATSMRDPNLHAGLIFATAFSWALLLFRFICWDARHKLVGPALDICNVILFSVLLGTCYRSYSNIFRWYNVIAEGALAVTILVSVAVRRSFTGHHAHYINSDVGGRTLWQDKVWLRCCDISSGIIGALFVVATCLSLIPILTHHYTGFSALNIIFNYILPLAIALAAALFLLAFGLRTDSHQATVKSVEGNTVTGTKGYGADAV